MICFLEKTKESERHFLIAFFVGIVSGILSAFVKGGTESILPPRTLDRIPPPIELLDKMGVNWHELFYTYSGQSVYWAGNLVHILLSIFAAVFYCVLAEIYPRIKMSQGIVFGVLFTIIAHGIALPCLGLSPSINHLPLDEIFSEIIGTCIWIWSIELIRSGLRNKLCK